MKKFYTGFRASLLDVQETMVDGVKRYTLDPAKAIRITKAWGITTRTLKKRGKVTLTIEDNIPSLAKELAVSMGAKNPDERLLTMVAMPLKAKLRAILTDGLEFGDTHYTLFSCSPGDQRAAQVNFINSTRAEAVDIMYQVTTLDKKSYVAAFATNGGKSGKCLMSKVLARETSTTAGSTPIAEMSALAAEYLNKIRVLETDDLQGVNTTPWRNPAPDAKGSTNGTTRETVPTDGMWYFGRFVGLCLCLAFGTLSEEEFLELMQEYEQNPASPKILDALLKADMPAVVQTRMPGSMKGAAHFADIELYTQCPCHAIVFKSVRKFEDKDWNGRMGELEICNHSHKGNGWVSMSAPIIGALVDADVHVMDDIVNHWLKTIEGIFSDDKIESSIAIAEVMGACPVADSEEQDMALINKAMTSNVLLAKDHYVWGNVMKKLRGFISRMAAGKLAVPGHYPFISVDPNWGLQELVNKGVVQASEEVIPVMKAGEYYFNNLQVRGLAARSPLTHPNQLKVLKLKKLQHMSMYKNVLVLNAYDGLWIDMAGADMDGDKCMLALELSKSGLRKEWMARILDSIKNEPVLNFEEAQGGQYVPLNRKERIDYLVSHAQSSKVGLLNDAYSEWQEIYCHLRNILKDGKECGVTEIIFNGKYSGENHYTIEESQGQKTLTCCSILGAIKPGTYSIAKVEDILSDIWQKIALLEILQSREVDSPKTGYVLEQSLLDTIEAKAISWSIVARRYSKQKYGELSDKTAAKAAQAKAREVAWNDKPYSKRQGFRAYTVLGRVTDLVSDWWDSHQEQCDGMASSYAGYLHCLLSDAERTQAAIVYNDVVAVRKEYTKRIQKNAKDKTLDETAKSVNRKMIINDIIMRLAEVATYRKVDLSAVAVACYYACYIKNSGTGEGLSFAWLLDSVNDRDEELLQRFEEANIPFVVSDKGYLLNIFSRGDMQFSKVSLPVPIGNNRYEVVTKHNTIHLITHSYKDHKRVNTVREHIQTVTKWKDGQHLNFSRVIGRLNCILQKSVDNSIDVTNTIIPSEFNKVGYVVFANTDPDALRQKLAEVNNMLTIEVGKEGGIIAAIEGEKVADVKLVYPESLKLLNKKVQWVENHLTREDDSVLFYAEYEDSIKNVKLMPVEHK